MQKFQSQAGQRISARGGQSLPQDVAGVQGAGMMQSGLLGGFEDVTFTWSWVEDALVADRVCFWSLSSATGIILLVLQISSFPIERTCPYWAIYRHLAPISFTLLLNLSLRQSQDNLLSCFSCEFITSAHQGCHDVDLKKIFIRTFNSQDHIALCDSHFAAVWAWIVVRAGQKLKARYWPDIMMSGKSAVKSHLFGSGSGARSSNQSFHCKKYWTELRLCLLVLFKQQICMSQIPLPRELGHFRSAKPSLSCLDSCPSKIHRFINMKRHWTWEDQFIVTHSAIFDGDFCARGEQNLFPSSVSRALADHQICHDSWQGPQHMILEEWNWIWP